MTAASTSTKPVRLLAFLGALSLAPAPGTLDFLASGVGSSTAHGAPAAGATEPVATATPAAPGALAARGDRATPTGAPEVRWSFGPLDFESEPVLLGERVLVTGRDPTGRRALVLLDAGSGRMLSRTLLPSPEPLEISVLGDRLAVKAAPNRVDVYRLRGARLLAERTVLHASSVSSPRLGSGTGVEAELLLREGDELVSYDLGAREPRWRTRLPGPARGAPEARENDVFAAWLDERGNAHLARLERTTGRLLADAVLGLHGPARTGETGAARSGDSTDAAVPGEHEPFELVVHPHEVFLRSPLGLRSQSGTLFPWARVPRAGEGFGTPVTLHDYLAEPLETPTGWIVPERTREGSVRWLAVERVDGRERTLELAAPAHHAWLTASTVAASLADGVLYLGPAAAELDTLRLLWKREPLPRFRPVPAPGGLLVVEGNLLRRLGVAPPPPVPEEERARELALQLDGQLASRLAELASKALRASDLALARRFVDEAEERGASGRAFEFARGEVERQEQNPRPVQHDPKRRVALEAEERSARERLPDELARAARLEPAPAARRALLAEVFPRAPEHEAGLEVLRTLLPARAELAPDQALSWLEFLEVSAELPIDLAAPPGDGEARTSEEQRLAEERSAWRPDVQGFQSARLGVVTAGAAPGAVARALAAGELVCDVLEQTFPAARRPTERLQLVLYPTREEYLQESGTDLGGLEKVLGWTAGHYDNAENVSRMFLPQGDEADARLLGVYAHELTHHWLATRSAFAPFLAEPTTRGFWIAEAVATWAEELTLDPARSTWESTNPRAASLDTLASASAADLIPWKAFLAACFDDYQELETRPTCSMSLTWQLGAKADRSPMQLFYAQGGALAHYLYDADGGRQRGLFLRAVEAYYRGTPLDVAATLRLSPEELGARVQAFARKLTTGG